MAEFCLNCWNKLNGTNDSKKKYVFSDGLELCEGCGEWKRVIVMKRKYYYLHKFRYVILPFWIIFNIVYILWRLLIIPYLIYKQWDEIKSLFSNKVINKQDK